MNYTVTPTQFKIFLFLAVVVFLLSSYIAFKLYIIGDLDD